MQTKRLLLVKFNIAHFEAILNNDNALLGKMLNANVQEGWTHFPEAMPFFEKIIKESPDNQWVSYFTLTQDNPTLIGTCGFKGIPTAEGVVEIGYEIRDDYQGQGYASEAAFALRDLAFQQGVSAVIAHTIAENNESTSVLKKAGFTFVKSLEDPEDGLIFQWRIGKD
jgi:[ribosomal protein S5]-alanine N-acetyltransferase